MRVILGIGNPGQKYQKTRHNVGFTVLDRFADKYKLSFAPSRGDYYLAGGTFNASSFFLVKPVTYVNNSGLAAKDIILQNNILLENFLVVADDIHLDTGKIRVRKSGGDGGHNGIHSIIYHLESDGFPRLRFGVGNDFKNGQMADFVLSKFEPDLNDFFNKKIDFAVELIKEFIVGGLQSMLDFYSKNYLTNDDLKKE